MMTNDARTYGWYVLHHFDNGRATYYDVSPDQEYANAPSPRMHLDHFRALGLIDQVPTFDNLVPLVEQYSEWYETVVESSSLYDEEEKRGGLMVTLHWTLCNILQCPTLDAAILRHVVRTFPRFTIPIVYNTSCPEDVMVALLEHSGTKRDPTRETNGGEIGCFILRNKMTPAAVIDMIAKKTKRTTIQRDVMVHTNVSRDTLVYLSQNGRSDRVKSEALAQLVRRGWLNVK